MALTIHLPAEAETQRRERATREGQGEETVAAILLAEALERAEAMEGIRHGLADSAAGRVTPLAEWDSNFRARHGIPQDAVPLSEAEAGAVP